MRHIIFNVAPTLLLQNPGETNPVQLPIDKQFKQYKRGDVAPPLKGKHTIKYYSTAWYTRMYSISMTAGNKESSTPSAPANFPPITKSVKRKNG